MTNQSTCYVFMRNQRQHQHNIMYWVSFYTTYIHYKFIITSESCQKNSNVNFIVQSSTVKHTANSTSRMMWSVFQGAILLGNGISTTSDVVWDFIVVLLYWQVLSCYFVFSTGLDLSFYFVNFVLFQSPLEGWNLKVNVSIITTVFAKFQFYVLLL